MTIAMPTHSAEQRNGRRAPKRGRLLAQRIVDDICDQGFGDGDSLASEPTLMETYGAGRSTFREAIRLLEANGIVHVQPGPGGGPVVSDADASDLADTLKLHLQVRGATYEEVARARVLIEPYLARLTALRQEPAALEELRTVMADIEAAEPMDKLTFNALAGRFHRALGRGSGNRVVDLMGALLVDINDVRFLHVMHLPPSEQTKVVGRWRRIADDIFDGRADDAERHVRHMLQYYADHLASSFPELASERVRWGEPRQAAGD